MSNKNNDRVERIKKILEPTEEQMEDEFISDLIKGSISGIPFAGGVILEILKTRMPFFQDKRLKNFSLNLAKELDKLEEKIDKKYVQKEEFVYLFEKTFRGQLKLSTPTCFSRCGSINSR